MFYQYFYHSKVSGNGGHFDLTKIPIIYVEVVCISTLGDYFFSKSYYFDLVGSIRKYS